MAQTRELTALDVKRLPAPDRPKMVAVGGVTGLYLNMTPTGGRSWIMRTTIGGKRRDVGLGSYPTVPLSGAREAARDMLAQVRLGTDPAKERQDAKAKLAKGQTFRAAAEDYLSRKLVEFDNPKHRQQWRNTLEKYAFPTLGTMDVAAITLRDVLAVLEPIWAIRTETASRLRGRIERILDAAAVAGHRPEDAPNPARWKGGLELLLAKRSKVQRVEHHPALPVQRLPAFWRALATRRGGGADALRFALLTAARSGEVRGATWEEIDLERALWTVGATRMKTRREHIVPLSRAALDLLQGLTKHKGNPLVFPAPKGGELTDMAFTTLIRKMDAGEIAAGREGWRDPKAGGRVATAHGIARSSFRDWAGDHTEHAREVIEQSLAHSLGAVEKAYRRSSALEKRRHLMQDWADYLTS
ncbi:site-specific integrase [Paracoccus sp. MC1854]|uniref:tyrosine-type recombinase/integrase n=1 Tax=Paracoccus sp. MC1854 TaxID=2760306 RepID=UPI002106710F|nr:site-specific integrase [Paracoccus sp. MC1854]